MSIRNGGSVGLKSRAAAGALVLALGLVTAWEGYNSKVYLDAVGIPTVCYGHVVPKSIEVGQAFTNEACHNLLTSDLKIAVDAFDKLVVSETEPYVKAAFISFIYNVGVKSFKNSTALKLINEGRIVDACHELPKWVYAKGKKLKGLVNRRQAEMELCLGE
jgi:lysozyme